MKTVLLAAGEKNLRLRRAYVSRLRRAQNKKPTALPGFPAH